MIQRVGGCTPSSRRMTAALLILLTLCPATLTAQTAPASQPTGMTTAELIETAKRIEPIVERLRGWKFKHPVKTDVYEEPALRKYIEKKVFEEQYAGGKLERTEAFLHLVGLIPPNCDLRKTTLDVLLSQIGGFYDPPTKSFYMLKRKGVDYGPLLNGVLIAHELTHALDDQYQDLQKLTENPDLSEDEAMAIASVVEGSATIVMIHYMRDAMDKMSGADEQTMQRDMQRVMESELERARPFIEAPRYFSALVAAYMCGAWFLTRNNAEEWADPTAGKRIGERVLQAMKDPPQSTEQILHGEKYWDRAHRDEPMRFDDGAITKLLEGSGQYVVDRNTVGELYCALLAAGPGDTFNMAAAAAPTYWTNDAATGWGGDRFFLLAEGSSREDALKTLRNPRGVWITAWDSADDRDEFFDDYKRMRDLPEWAAVKVGARVAIFYSGCKPDEAEKIQARISAQPLTLHQGSSSVKN